MQGKPVWWGWNCVRLLGSHWLWLTSSAWHETLNFPDSIDSPLFVTILRYYYKVPHFFKKKQKR
eukprot:scaffold1669_cov129-Cylindrotheca_fusiformis.AAC.32